MCIILYQLSSGAVRHLVKASNRFSGWLRSKKRHLRNPKVKAFLKFFLVLAVILVYLYGIKFPHDREILASRMQEEITKVLGTRLTEVHLRPEDNTTRLQPSFACDIEAKLFSLILIKSKAENAHLRSLQRQTWKKLAEEYATESTKAFFFISVPTNADIPQYLIEESQSHNDIIVEDLPEHRHLLVVKSLRMLKWFKSFNTKCRTTLWFMKTDETSFINIPNTMDYLNSIPNSWINYIGGVLHIQDTVATDPASPQFSPEEWSPNGPYHPPYVTGPLVIFASDVVPQILKASVTTPLINLEDVFLTGTLGYEKLGILPYNIPRIQSKSSKFFLTLKTAFSTSFLTTNLAFDCSQYLELMVDLYRYLTQDGKEMRSS